MKHILKIFLLLSMFPQHISSQFITNDPFCINSTAIESLSNRINMADLIIEATRLTSEKTKDESDFLLSSTYRIEKIFKGNFKEFKINVSVSEKKLLNGLIKKYPKFKEISPTIKPGEIGETIILFLKKVKEKEYEVIVDFPSVSYQINENKLAPKRKKHFLIYNKIGSNVIEFESAEDLYTYILSHSNTMCKDLTQTEFIKKRKY